MENISVVNATHLSSVQIVKPLFISAEGDWRLKTLQTVLNMARLPKGRESWRLQRPEPIARLAALRFVEKLIENSALHQLPAPFVVPTADKGVQLEWSNKQREIEIEFSPDGSIEFLELENGKVHSEGSLSSTSDSASRALFDWLLSA